LLNTWRDNDSKLKPLIERSFLLHEIAPLSDELSSLGAVGLTALDYLDKSETSPESWRTQQLALTDSAKAPKADLLLVVVQPVRQLVEATAR
jgi:hexosaminidase